MNLGGRETSLAERQLSESRWATYSNQERGAWYGHGKGFAQDLKTSGMILAISSPIPFKNCIHPLLQGWWFMYCTP